MSDRNDPRDAYSDGLPPARPTPRRYEADEPEDEPLPSLARRTDGGLGNLAQAARDKQISTARILLFIVGVMEIGMTIVGIFLLHSNIDEEIRKAGGAQNVPRQQVELAYMIGYGLSALAILVGVTFLVLGALVKRFPLACTISGLVLFIVVQLIAAFVEPKTLVQGWLLKIIFVVCLIKAIQAAAAYQREEPMPEADS